MLVERRSLNSIAPLREKVMTPLASLPMISTIALRSERQMIGASSWPKYINAKLLGLYTMNNGAKRPNS